MKAEIHPKYDECAVKCSCGNEFTTRSTVDEVNVQICSNCHPFFTGKQKLVDSAGRVEKFMRRYGKTTSAAKKAEEAKAAEAAADTSEEDTKEAGAGE